MKIEIMIYAYMLICFSLIIFNLLYMFTERWKKGLFRFEDKSFEKIMRKSWEEDVTNRFRKKLRKKLKNPRYLVAFNKALERFRDNDPVGFNEYIIKIDNTLANIFVSYEKKDELKVSFLCYLICKYPFFRQRDYRGVVKKLLNIVSWENIYCRINAFKALCFLKNIDDIILGFKILSRQLDLNNPKVIVEVLLSFEGDKNELMNRLWGIMDEIPPLYQVAVINYLRFSSGAFREKILKLNLEKNLDLEVVLASCRYFSKYKYDQAFPFILELAKLDEKISWEKKAVASTALGSYQSEKSIEALMENLSCKNWYVRTNSADSLIKLGLDYLDLIEIMEGKDRYARESLQYQLDKEKTRKEV